MHKPAEGPRLPRPPQSRTSHPEQLIEVNDLSSGNNRCQKIEQRLRVPPLIAMKRLPPSQKHGYHKG
jgi:hypothetical protein